MTDSAIRAAEAMKDAAAKVADRERDEAKKTAAPREMVLIAMTTARDIAANIRALPLPEPEPDPRGATIARLTAELVAATKERRICSVCGEATDLCCSDCRINFRTTVYVCRKPSCRDDHEIKCYGDGRREDARKTLTFAKQMFAHGDKHGFSAEEMTMVNQRIDAAIANLAATKAV